MQQLLLSQGRLSQERLGHCEAETHVIILHTTRKFVTATPTSITDRQQKSVYIQLTYASGVSLFIQIFTIVIGVEKERVLHCFLQL